MDIKAIVGTQLGGLTLRKSTTTNPFEHNSFKGKAFGGSALPFADVFQSIKPIEEKPNKLKMLSCAVVGAVSSFKNNITQPIANFAHNVKQTVMHGVDAVKNAGNTIAEMGKNVQNKISSVFEFNKTPQNVNLEPKILSMKHINNKASVQDLKATWLAENALIDEKAGKAVA
jgi:hypothetical protein